MKIRTAVITLTQVLTTCVVLVACGSDKPTAALAFSEEVFVNMSFRQDRGFFSKPESFILTLQPEAIATYRNGEVRLQYSICNVGDTAYDLSDDRTLYLWYTPSEDRKSVNWESCCIRLKPGECETQTLGTKGYDGFELSKPLGTLHASTTDKVSFGKIDLSTYSESTGQVTFISPKK